MDRSRSAVSTRTRVADSGVSRLPSADVDAVDLSLLSLLRRNEALEMLIFFDSSGPASLAVSNLDQARAVVA